jgi:hypothetical protein
MAIWKSMVERTMRKKKIGIGRAAVAAGALAALLASSNAQAQIKDYRKMTADEQFAYRRSHEDNSLLSAVRDRTGDMKGTELIAKAGQIIGQGMTMTIDVGPLNSLSGIAGRAAFFGVKQAGKSLTDYGWSKRH